MVSAKVAKASSQSVAAAVRFTRMLGACTGERSRSLTMATTTSVAVRTPGVASRWRAWSLRMARAATICGSPSSAHGGVDVGQVERHRCGHVEPPPEDVEQLGGGVVQGEQLVGLGPGAEVDGIVVELVAEVEVVAQLEPILAVAVTVSEVALGWPAINAASRSHRRPVDGAARAEGHHDRGAARRRLELELVGEQADQRDAEAALVLQAGPGR